MHEGVWTVKCCRGSTVNLCMCVWDSQSFSQLGCCCLTMAVLSADVLRWHVSFYLTFPGFLFMLLLFLHFGKLGKAQVAIFFKFYNVNDLPFKTFLKEM